MLDFVEVRNPGFFDPRRKVRVTGSPLGDCAAADAALNSGSDESATVSDKVEDFADDFFSILRRTASPHLDRVTPLRHKLTPM